ncbi:MAG: acetyltransferase [Rhodospirillales bacterium]|nr:acetyltransferase [Rhodospirillales bacterium]
MQPTPTRLWFLDWIRVAAFGVLIPYHVGMLYSSWDWLAKSSYADPAVDPWLLVSSPWRLPLLFFVSGAAARFLRDRTTTGEFARRRLLRLGVPLVFGVLVVCAPTVYLESRAANAIEPGILHFLSRYWMRDPSLRFGLDWEHLWFVAYVLVYALLAAPWRDVIVRATRIPAVERLFGSRWGVALGPALLTALLYCATRGSFPITNNLVRDWANHAVCLPYFLLGFAAVRSEGFWSSIEMLRWPMLFAAVPLYGIEFWASGQYEQDLLLRFATRFARCVYAWAAIAAVLGFGRRWFNRPGATIAWLNRGVFCFYIVHQPVIVVAAAAIAPLRLGVVGEPIVLLLTTAASCLAIYVVADRLGPAKLLLGLPLESAGARRQRLAQQQLAEQG